MKSLSTVSFIFSDFNKGVRAHIPIIQDLLHVPAIEFTDKFWRIVAHIQHIEYSKEKKY